MFTWITLATAMAAPPEGVPVPVVEHGRVQVSVGLSGDQVLARSRGDEAVAIARAARILRVELVLFDGLALWGRGSWTASEFQTGATTSNAAGWNAAFGVDGVLWPLPWLGVALQGSGAWDMAWQRGSDDLLDVWHRSIDLTATAGALLGPKGGGVYGLVGVRGQTWLVEDTDLVEADLDLALVRPHPISAVLGAELHSDNLLGWGSRGHLVASIGGEVRIGDGVGGGLWLGLAF